MGVVLETLLRRGVHARPCCCLWIAWACFIILFNAGDTGFDFRLQGDSVQPLLLFVELHSCVWGKTKFRNRASFFLCQCKGLRCNECLLKAELNAVNNSARNKRPARASHHSRGEGAGVGEQRRPLARCAMQSIRLRAELERGWRNGGGRGLGCVVSQEGGWAALCPLVLWTILRPFVSHVELRAYSALGLRWLRIHSECAKLIASICQIFKRESKYGGDVAAYRVQREMLKYVLSFCRRAGV